MAQRSVLRIFPYMTEKSLTKAGVGCYTFKVPKSVNKPEIKKIISERFKVKVKKVNVQTRPRRLVKRITRRGRTAGYRSPYKLAFIYLEKGETIEGFEIKGEKAKKDEKKTT